MNLDKSTPDLFGALALAQAEVENASKASVNPHYKSRYADLAEVLNTVRPVFARHGLALMQSTEFDGATVSVTTVIAHKSGGAVSSKASCVPAKVDAQGIGAATTYLRRYGLAAMCGVAQEDDDGNSAAHSKPPAAPAVPSDALISVLTKLHQAQTLADLDAVKPALAALPVAERQQAVALGIARKNEITASIITNP